jgi:hypothetical protein
MPAPNPYAPPAEHEAEPVPLTPGPGAGFYRDGECLMVRNRTVLPDFCPFTGLAGQPGEIPHWRPLIWSPRWVDWGNRSLILLYPFFLLFYNPATMSLPGALGSIGIALGSIGIAISSLNTRGRAKTITFLVGYPVSSSFASSFRRWRIAILIRSLVTTGLFIAAGAYYQHPNKPVLLSLIALLIVPGFPWLRKIRVTSHRDGWFRVRNCHPDFLAILPDTVPEIRLALPPDPEPAGTCLRDGSYLFVQDGATLPGICPFTGIPVEEKWPKRRLALSWAPAWAYLSVTAVPLTIYFSAHLMERIKPFRVLATVIPILIVSFLFARFGKQGAIHCTSSPGVQRKKAWLQALSVLLIALSFLIMFKGLKNNCP